MRQPESTLLGSRNRPRRRRRPDPDRLDVHDLSDTERGQLASVTAPLDATERQARIRGYHAVHEHRSGFDLSRQRLAELYVAGPEARTEAIRGVVRRADGIVRVAHPQHR